MTRSRTTKRSVLAAAMVVVAAVLSSCSTHPGSAAVVGDERISDARLDDVASALCSAQAGSGANGQPQDLASRSARQIALGVLLDSALSRQFGESEGVEPDQGQVSSAVASREQVIGALPKEHREGFREALREFAAGQLVVSAIGRRSLASQGKQNATEEQAVSEGTKLRNAWVAKNLDVSVDPRFGEYSKGSLVSKSGSLSIAESTRATDGDSPDPSPGWVASLPANQKCS